MEQSVENFKNELKSLLEKYNATIGFDMNGETSEMYDTGMIIEIDNKQVYKIADWEISKYDL